MSLLSYVGVLCHKLNMLSLKWACTAGNSAADGWTCYWSQVVMSTVRGYSRCSPTCLHRIVFFVQLLYIIAMELVHALLGLRFNAGCWQMTLTGSVLSSLFYRDRPQWARSRREVNFHCRRTIYRRIYPLLMDRAIEERNGLAGVKKWIWREFEVWCILVEYQLLMCYL